MIALTYNYITNNITGPFRVAFMEKTYTVDESVGGVNVCVHLTLPMRDILDETVNVFVIDDPSSIYIPTGAPLASVYYYHSVGKLKYSLEWIGSSILLA